MDGRLNIVNTGTEASERAIKIARIWGAAKSPDKNVIIGFRRNFHGKTMGAMMAATTPEAKSWIPFHDPNMGQISFHIHGFLTNLVQLKNQKQKKFFFDELDKLFQENPHILKQYKCVYTRKLPRLGCNILPQRVYKCP